MKKQKNRFLSLVFSCMPGAAQMYMGFMNRGLVLMAAFFFSLVLSFSFWGMLILASVLIWFYAFFDGINLAWADAEVFENESDSVQIMGGFVGENFLSRRKGTMGVILILVGLYNVFRKFHWILKDLAWRYLGENFLYAVDSIPQIFISLVIIAFGIKLILGKKKEMKEND